MPVEIQGQGFPNINSPVATGSAQTSEGEAPVEVQLTPPWKYLLQSLWRRTGSAQGIPTEDVLDIAEDAQYKAEQAGRLAGWGAWEERESGTEIFSLLPGQKGEIGPSIIGAMGPPGWDGEDGNCWIIPLAGPQGLRGESGATIPGQDGCENGEWPIPLSGPRGVQGISGQFIPGRDGEDGDTPFVVLPPPATTTTFQAQLSANQTIVAGATTKLTLDQQNVDTDGTYDPTLNRWTPRKGVIQVATFALAFAFTVTDVIVLRIIKNGVTASPLAQDVFKATSSGMFLVARTSTFDLANGTDYYEVFVSAGVNNVSIEMNLSNTAFSGASFPS